MFGDCAQGGTQQIGFLLLPRFSMMALSSALEPLRMANAICERTLYAWDILSEDGEPVTASNGMENLVTSNINSLQRFPMVVVCASYDPHLVATHNVGLWLQRQARHGSIVGGMDTGSYILARTGLLSGYRATIHWELLDTFAETFPEVDVAQDIFVVDRNRFTSAGATASLDMMLFLIRRQHGPDLARKVAEQFIYAGERDSHAQQRMSTAERISLRNSKLGKAIAYFAANLEDPVPTAHLADVVGLSVRALERMFSKWLQTTPAKYHRELRLEKAKSLVQQTSLPMLEIAHRCGFSSAAHFSKAYSDYFEKPPSADRGYTRITH